MNTFQMKTLSGQTVRRSGTGPDNNNEWKSTTTTTTRHAPRARTHVCSLYVFVKHVHMLYSMRGTNVADRLTGFAYSPPRRPYHGTKKLGWSSWFRSQPACLVSDLPSPLDAILEISASPTHASSPLVRLRALSVQVSPTLWSLQHGPLSHRDHWE